MPSLIRRESLSSQADLSSHSKLKLVICDLKECQKLPYQYPNVTLVDQSVGELQSTPTDRNVSIAKTIEDDVSMALHGGCVYCDYLVEGVKGYIAAIQR
jgi:hypothetical protein